ncbi:MAG: hypothetical protein A2252_08965 [Elusimicrobia bacterium RIFOXYA2_FULL_39_19]|nr:MAG: hypothetical protein A2252_08965 [Elusimicrobia bacterium RIFOXYA2_FULL_39_19]
MDWLLLKKDDLLFEKQQCIEEGRDFTGVLNKFNKLIRLNLKDIKNQLAVKEFLNETQKLPHVKNYKYKEPSDIKAILKLRDKAPKQLKLNLSKNSMLDKIYGAWLGRCAGCLLGKPVECWPRVQIVDVLKKSGQYPLKNYIKASKIPKPLFKKYNITADRAFVDQVDGMPADDDINYTITGLAIIEKYGVKFTPENVAEFWMCNIPIICTCTAERIAYRNFANAILPPESAVYGNPYREWIGAQIRADFWGYVMPGKIEEAANFAFRDASISHIKNGIYGEMWVAAMLSASYAENDMEKIINLGLSQIPNTSRLYEAVKEVISWKKSGITSEQAINKIHKIYKDTNFHHWCHTISNAMVVTASLLYGEKDFEKTITMAVDAGFDTDCNGATAGSVLGLVLGAKKLPKKWTAPLKNKIASGIRDFEKVEILEMAEKTLKLQ